MNDTEDRLLARIDVRRALATVLTPRQREVVRRVSRLGQTYREAGLDLRISPERVRQLYFKAELLLRRRLRRPPAKLAPVGTPPPGFDRAAFLEHMRGVIARRKAEADAEFERDAAELARMVQREQQGAAEPTAAELHAELVAEYKAQQAQQAGGAGEGGGPSSAGPGASGANDKVLDADFEEVDDQKKRGSG